MKFKTQKDIEKRLEILFSRLNIPSTKNYYDLPSLCSDFECFNDTVVPKNIKYSMWNGQIIDVIEPQNLNRMHCYETLLTLMSCLRSCDKEDYEKLHPNRLKLKFFWLYRLNLLDKSATCYQERKSVDPDDPDNSDDSDFDVEEIANEIRSILGLPMKLESELINRETHCFNSVIPSCTSPPRTPTLHGSYDSRYCWGFFVIKCERCNYRVWKSKSVKCLACYYFRDVLNELHEKWASLSKIDRSKFLKKK